MHESQYDEIPNSYDCGNISPLIPYKIIDKGDMDMYPWCDTDMDAVPQFIKDLTDSCCFDVETAIKIGSHIKWFKAVM